MEKKYKIIYLPLFYDDLVKIIAYIKYKLTNEIAAENFINELEKEIKKREYNTNAYEKYISSKKRKDVYYKIYVKNYTVFYTIKENTVEVRRILSNRRNFKKII